MQIFAQSTVEIENLYTNFLDLEYERPLEAKLNLDRGLELSKKIHNDELIGFGFKYLSWYYEDQFQEDQALGITDSCIHYFLLADNTVELVNAFNFKGNLLSDNALLDSALFWYDKSMLLARENKDTIGIAKLANNIALVYCDKGEYLEAIDLFHESIE